jgi:hypothetical protein
MTMLCNDLGREDRGDGSVYRRLPAFVPVCANNGTQLLQSAQKSPNRVERHWAETREVTQYEALTMMIQIPSLAPFFIFCGRQRQHRKNPVPTRVFCATFTVSGFSAFLVS